jgi:hypothetical protein
MIVSGGKVPPGCELVDGVEETGEEVTGTVVPGVVGCV